MKISSVFSIVAALLLFNNLKVEAQFSAQKGKTIKELVEILVGQENMIKNQVSNIRYNGTNVDNDQTVQWGTGTYENFDGIGEGIVLSTMKIENLNGAPENVNNICHEENNSASAHHEIIDSDLSEFCGSNSLFDGHVIEFDFIPQGKSLNFKYSFASDEYPYYVCSKFNDAFGFFLSGPEMARAMQLSTLPITEVAVAINTVNGGQDGTSFIPPCGTGPIQDVIPCNLNNSAFFRDNLTNKYIPEMEFNGYTIGLEAKYDDLRCGEKYTLKLVIADVNDHRFNSGIFLSSENFSLGWAPLANLSKLEVPVCSPLEVKAQNGIGAPKEIWIWGDGSVPDTIIPGGQEVYHTYKEPNTYTVKLVGIDDNLSCNRRDTAESKFVLSTTNDPTVQLDDFSTDKVCLDKGIVLSLPKGSPTGGNYSGNGIVDGVFDADYAGEGMHAIFYAFTDSNNCQGVDSAQVLVDRC